MSGNYDSRGDMYDEYDSQQGGNSHEEETHEQSKLIGSGIHHEEGKMFIGGLNWETTDESLKEYFSQYGEVNECMVMREPQTGKSRGFGFLTFVDPKVVDEVVKKEHQLDGKMIDPKRAIPREEQEKTEKIFVGGIAPDVTEEEFRDFFAQFGNVIDATLMTDRDTGRPRGFGFITFESDIGVEEALKRTDLILHDKTVEVKKAMPKHKAQQQKMMQGGLSTMGGMGMGMMGMGVNGMSGMYDPRSAYAVAAATAMGRGYGGAGAGGSGGGAASRYAGAATGYGRTDKSGGYGSYGGYGGYGGYGTYGSYGFGNYDPRTLAAYYGRSGYGYGSGGYGQWSQGMGNSYGTYGRSGRSAGYDAYSYNRSGGGSSGGSNNQGTYSNSEEPYDETRQGSPSSEQQSRRSNQSGGGPERSGSSSSSARGGNGGHNSGNGNGGGAIYTTHVVRNQNSYHPYR